MGYDYEIEYRPRRENKAVNALSRLHGELSAVTYQQPAWLEEICNEAHHDPKLSSIKEALKNGAHNTHGLVERDRLLWNKDRLVLPPNSSHKEGVIHEFHNTPMGGHSSMFRTYKRIVSNFYWVGMKKDIQDYIQRCDTCQWNKSDILTPAGLLQPLPIPDYVWEDVSMDFIDGLPMYNGSFVILMVVDQLSKYGHFIA